MLRGRISGCVVFLDHLTPGVPSRSASDPTWESARAVMNVDNRFSSHRNDCYFGNLAFQFCEHVTAMHAAELGAFAVHFRKLELELESFFFHMELPWSMALRARWRIGFLLARLARVVRETNEQEAAARGVAPQQSRCDLAEFPEDDELFRLRGANGMLPPHVAEDFLGRHGRGAAWAQGSMQGRCPLALMFAVLNLVLMMRMGRARVTGFNLQGTRRVRAPQGHKSRWAPVSSAP